MSDSVYGTGGSGSRESAAVITAIRSTSAPSRHVDRPQSRLS